MSIDAARGGWRNLGNALWQGKDWRKRWGPNIVPQSLARFGSLISSKPTPPFLPLLRRIPLGISGSWAGRRLASTSRGLVPRDAICHAQSGQVESCFHHFSWQKAAVAPCWRSSRHGCNGRKQSGTDIPRLFLTHLGQALCQNPSIRIVLPRVQSSEWIKVVDSFMEKDIKATTARFTVA